MEAESDIIDTTTSANDLVTIKNVLSVLSRHYPDHPWAVRIDGGILEVKNQGAHGTLGFAVPLTALQTDYSKKIVMAGGELLERFRLRRGAARGDDYALMRRDVRGEGVADL